MGAGWRQRDGEWGEMWRRGRENERCWWSSHIPVFKFLEIPRILITNSLLSLKLVTEGIPLHSMGQGRCL